MKTNKFILLSLSLALVIHLVESFDFDEKELESEEGLQGMYERWRSHHNVADLSGEEKAERFNVFKANVHHVHKTNKMNKPYKLKVNKFATMTNHEFRNTYASSKISHYRALRGPRNHNLGFMYETAENIPAAIDWRAQNAVTPVRNQGVCGCCWAFSTVASVEGINAIKTGELIPLSEQHLIDCNRDTNNACHGGLMQPAFIFIADQGGLATQKNYPFIGHNLTCDPTKIGTEVVKIDGYEDVPELNEDALMKAVAHQPVSAAIEANGHDIQFYSSGVFTGRCGVDVNHAVTVVGYGTSPDGMKYWIVKNSWVPSGGKRDSYLCYGEFRIRWDYAVLLWSLLILLRTVKNPSIMNSRVIPEPS